MARDTGFFSDELIKKIRKRFKYVDKCPYKGERIFFDSASGSLRLSEMVSRVNEENSLPDNVGRASSASKHCEKIIEQGEENLQKFLGASNGRIITSESSTKALYRIVQTVMSNFSEGNVVTTSLDHPATHDSTLYFANYFDMERRVVSFSKQDGKVITKKLLNKIDKDTCLLAIIHCSNVTGAINDIDKIIEYARKINPDIYVVIDGVQFVSHRSISIDNIKPDAYVFSGYKSFCKKGISYVYLSDRLANLEHYKLHGQASDTWNLGTVDHAAFAAWNAVFDYLCWLGSHFVKSHNSRKQIVTAMEKINKHSLGLLNRVLTGNGSTFPGLLNMDHVKIYGINLEGMKERNCLVSFTINDLTSKKAVIEYEKKGVRLHYRGLTAYSKHILKELDVSHVIRFSACHYNTPEEVDRFLMITQSMN